MTTGNLRITELDFDTIRNNLIDYLKAQPTFSDYNFDGSGLTVLLNSLAYNTHYLAFVASMGFNEKYLDSAVTRSAVVSAAKSIGYTPSSATAPTASVDIVVSNVTGSPTTLTLPKYSNFSATVAGTSYTFVNTESVIATRIGSTFTFGAVDIKEGSPLLFSYIVGNETSQIYEIPNDNVDVSTIKVFVQNSISDLSKTTYKKYNALAGIDGTSLIYFIDENYKGKLQVQFGDGIIGKKLTNGNVVIIEYLSTNDISANGVKNFSINGNVFGSGSTAVVTTTAASINGASGGAERQSLTSIKFSAPKSYVAQNRLVTTNDFGAEISSVSGIETVSVWGGEDNDPPVYGKVFISAKPFGSLYLSDTVKNDILLNRLKPKKVATITPAFVDPNYTFINATVTIKYDTGINNIGVGDMEQLVRASILTFQSQSLGKFNSSFFYDSFLTFLKTTDLSIVSTFAQIKLQKRITPIFNVSGNYDIKFNIPIRQNRVESTKFYFSVDGIIRLLSIRDISTDTAINPISTGTLQIWDADTGVVYESNAGSVDYSYGYIKISPLYISYLPQDVFDIRLTVTPQENIADVPTFRNNILLFDDSHINSVINLKNGIIVNVYKA